MGAKLFAWIGGLALFIGIAFLRNICFSIPDPAGDADCDWVHRRFRSCRWRFASETNKNAVTAQTLCATGILVLYAVTFACRAYYHFAFFGLIPTFLLMTLITAVAFLLSVRLNAIIVAVLGIAGGFLTPILLSTNQDNPLGLFGYIALLNIGLLALAQRQRWNALPILGAIGTALMESPGSARSCFGEIFRRQQSPHLHGGVCWVSGTIPSRGRVGKAHRKSEHHTFRMCDRSRGGGDVRRFTCLVSMQSRIGQRCCSLICSSSTLAFWH